MQSRFASFVEAWVNVLIGFTINFCANLLILPLFGFTPSLAENFMIGVLFTVISVARSYLLRRWFNNRLTAWVHKLQEAWVNWRISRNLGSGK